MMRATTVLLATLLVLFASKEVSGHYGGGSWRGSGGGGSWGGHRGGGSWEGDRGGHRESNWGGDRGSWHGSGDRWGGRGHRWGGWGYWNREGSSGGRQDEMTQLKIIFKILARKISGLEISGLNGKCNMNILIQLMRQNKVFVNKSYIRIFINVLRQKGISSEQGAFLQSFLEKNIYGNGDVAQEGNLINILSGIDMFQIGSSASDNLASLKIFITKFGSGSGLENLRNLLTKIYVRGSMTWINRFVVTMKSQLNVENVDWLVVMLNNALSGNTFDINKFVNVVGSIRTTSGQINITILKQLGMGWLFLTGDEGETTTTDTAEVVVNTNEVSTDNVKFDVVTGGINQEDANQLTVIVKNIGDKVGLSLQGLDNKLNINAFINLLTKYDVFKNTNNIQVMITELQKTAGLSSSDGATLKAILTRYLTGTSYVTFLQSLYSLPVFSIGTSTTQNRQDLVTFLNKFGTSTGLQNLRTLIMQVYSKGSTTWINTLISRISTQTGISNLDWLKYIINFSLKSDASLDINKLITAIGNMRSSNGQINIMEMSSTDYGWIFGYSNILQMIMKIIQGAMSGTSGQTQITYEIRYV